MGEIQFKTPYVMKQIEEKDGILWNNTEEIGAIVCILILFSIESEIKKHTAFFNNVEAKYYFRKFNVHCHIEFHWIYKKDFYLFTPIIKSVSMVDCLCEF